MKWNILEADETSVIKKYDVGSLTGKILASSSLSDEQIRELVNPDFRLSTSRALCVQKACERILAAKKNGEKIFVGGDYDADGICSTAIMKRTLDLLGIPNGYYIPDRFKEGYGLSPVITEAAVKKGYSLIITVDNGVKAHDALAKARELKTDVIVTDHHTIEEAIDADIVVHPDYMEEEYSTLSGAGVALEISRNLIGDRPELTALAAVAAIGDVMPLWKETRRIVGSGIEILRQGRPQSVCALFRPNTKIDETAIAFQIVPKLNSVGRLNDTFSTNVLVEYLLADHPYTIQDFVPKLNAENDKRRALSKVMAMEAEQLVNDDPFQIIFSESFEEGICGLVAGRLASELHKPVLVMAESGDMIKGSARGVDGFNVFEFFSGFEELQAFGGHAMAAGITIRKEDLDTFRAHVQTKMESDPFEYEEPVRDAILIDADQLNIDDIMGLEILEPCPAELKETHFAVKNPVILAKTDYEKITKYRIANNTGGFEGLVFKSRELDLPEELSVVIGRPSLNVWRGKTTCQLDIEYAE